MISNRFGYILIGLAAAMAAGTASAQASLAPVDIQSHAPIDLSFSHTELGKAAAQSSALHAAGMARTSVDQHLSGDGVVGSFGFICGIQPAYIHSGAADVRGFDPDGKFLGAKLSLAFR